MDSFNRDAEVSVWSIVGQFGPYQQLQWREKLLRQRDGCQISHTIAWRRFQRIWQHSSPCTYAQFHRLPQFFMLELIIGGFVQLGPGLKAESWRPVHAGNDSDGS
jgi:hypothetical protein